LYLCYVHSCQRELGNYSRLAKAQLIVFPANSSTPKIASNIDAFPSRERQATRSRRAQVTHTHGYHALFYRTSSKLQHQISPARFNRPSRPTLMRKVKITRCSDWFHISRHSSMDTAWIFVTAPMQRAKGHGLIVRPCRVDGRDRRLRGNRAVLHLAVLPP